MPHGLVCAFVACATAAAALGLRSWPLAAFVVAPGIAAFLEVSLPRLTVVGSTWIVRAAAAATAFAGLITTLYPVIPEAAVFRATSACLLYTSPSPRD